MPIPARVHFLWIGRRVPWVHAYAVRTASARSGFGEVVFHHTDPLEAGAPLEAIAAAPGVRLAPLDADALLREAGGRLGLGDALNRLHRALPRPVPRADLLRAALLLVEGGIYLDLDTVTVAPLAPLTDVAAFAGSESIVWTAEARASRDPVRRARHLGLDLARKACRAAPDGWRAFRRVQGAYPVATNNAVLGAEPGAAAIADLLGAMARMPPARAASPYALGPRLLDAVAARHGPDQLAIHPPGLFYPLPPEIAAHWFRPTRRVRLDAMLGAPARVVHWYSSGAPRRAVDAIDPGRIASHRDRVPYCALVAACLAGPPGA